MAEAGGDGTSLEFTPSWVMALVCFGTVLISITVNIFLLYVGERLEERKMQPLVGALRKIKEELMVLGFISLLLAVFQTRIGKICISERLANVWLPCKKPDSSTVASFTTSSFASSGARGRRLLAEASNTNDYCSQKGKVALLSVEALHHLDIFIFVLATFHVILCVLKIRQWRKLEELDAKSTHYSRLRSEIFKKKLENYTSNGVERFFTKLGNKSAVHGWVMSFFKQFYPSVTEFEYIALRLNFIEAHDLNNPKEDFQKYIIGAVQKDFQKMVGISWYLWLFAVIFLLVNVAGWHVYFWISFIPLTLLLIVGTNMEHMITQLANAVADKHPQNEKESSKESAEALVDKFSKENFWCRRPRLLRTLVHIVLFENSLEIAFFFFILFQYDFHSCVMGKVGFVVPRIAIGVFVQFMCIYRIIPLYAIMKSQIPSKEKQSAKESSMCLALEEIKMHLKENQSDRCIKTFLDDLFEVKIRSLENQTEEEEDTWIVTDISKCVDKIKERLKQEAAEFQSTQTGSREGSVGVATTESG